MYINYKTLLNWIGNPHHYNIDSWQWNSVPQAATLLTAVVKGTLTARELMSCKSTRRKARGFQNTAWGSPGTCWRVWNVEKGRMRQQQEWGQNMAMAEWNGSKKIVGSMAAKATQISMNKFTRISPSRLLHTLETYHPAKDWGTEFGFMMTTSLKNCWIFKLN